jgi:hypothetical protein
MFGAAAAAFMPANPANIPNLGDSSGIEELDHGPVA